MVVDHRRNHEPTSINYRTLAEGQAYYEDLGYEYIEAPWVVEPESVNTTLPLGRIATSVSYGDLVGSGEQSFIELLRRGGSIEKAQCITPCFRIEDSYDELHHAYFMKLELINTDATRTHLHEMVEDALGFFAQYLDVAVVKTGPDMFDIVDRAHGIELGSYGFRSLDTTMFIYGTGVALPRLDTVLSTYQIG